MSLIEFECSVICHAQAHFTLFLANVDFSALALSLKNLVNDVSLTWLEHFTGKVNCVYHPCLSLFNP